MVHAHSIMINSGILIFFIVLIYNTILSLVVSVSPMAQFHVFNTAQNALHVS